MLYEGAISSVVTLNFDLALSEHTQRTRGWQHYWSDWCPEVCLGQKFVIYFTSPVTSIQQTLNHGCCEPPPLHHDWQSQWEPIITQRVLTAPVVIFAGLGTPVAVLIESTKLIRNALAPVTRIYLVDPSDKAESKFFQELGLAPTAHIQSGWCQFMDKLSQRLQKEQISHLEHAIVQKVRDDNLHIENVVDILARLAVLGLLAFGSFRARWLLYEKPY